MLRQMLEQLYEKKIEDTFTLDRREAFKGEGWFYIVERPGSWVEDDISELQKMASHMSSFGDRNVPGIIASKNGKFISEWEGNQFCVLACQRTDKRNVDRLGRKLAKFHERGRRIPFQVQRTARIGKWKGLWEKRIDQMEKVWSERLFQTNEDEFGKIFLETFPYYMGMAENAIQYLIDTEIDDQPGEADGGTVCHERFSKSSWGKETVFKNPFEWVFDHRSRDMAEWTRERYFQNNQTCGKDISQFFSDYQSVIPISPFAWRILYARLLFPLHYFESVERYYITGSEEEKRSIEDKMQKMLKQSGEYEQFLGRFYETAGVVAKKNKLPKPEWLPV